MTGIYPALLIISPLIIGWLLDYIFGDPERLPHPIILFGKLISYGEKALNKGRHRKLKGGIMAIALILMVYIVSFLIILLGTRWLGFVFFIVFNAIMIFYCLAGTTLIREVKNVFIALDSSLEEGRCQVARIVGRDTSQLSEQEVRKAALETLAENLSDGVIAPLFWYAMLGVPGMLAYKMINTLDSMIGYHTQRYIHFGCIAAHIDDIANYIPARLTALLMIFANAIFRWEWRRIGALLKFTLIYGNHHASPNSGWPEAALAGVLHCRFGGPHYYFGEYFPKPYIGKQDKILSSNDVNIAIKLNRGAEILMLIIIIGITLAIY